MLTVFWILQSLLFIGCCCALKCWHCISDNCDIDPDDNERAEQRTCKRGQYCQKVYFEMHSTFENKQLYSTVRGCAWDCSPKNDFRNCSRDLYSSRGCIEKMCCNDNDLCNGSNIIHMTGISRILGMLIFTTIISNMGFT
ncbi:uncharacterized protein LOC134705781 [Mytilus trossulus]|uniref:uncharacterized protein LOC134705781 n=1 Tax=Mytilus trossulus TaxID=6551 RepID=UPI0030041DF6